MALPVREVFGDAGVRIELPPDLGETGAFIGFAFGERVN
jgi:hypothetical protein